MKITVGHTPDADDAFMFYAMLEKKIPDPGFEISHVIEDIESLNKRASGPGLDVTAVSVHACARLDGYTMLRSGGSFGLGYGPIVAAARRMSLQEVARSKVAVPGEATSAFLLLRTMAGEFDYETVEFSRIPGAVREGRADAGLIIHEAQIAYADEGLVKALDLGRWWHERTGGLPVPLGVNVMRSSLGGEAVAAFDRHLRASIEYARSNFDEALDYAMRYSRGRSRKTIAEFVRMYVNDLTVEMGEPGSKAVSLMFRDAADAGLAAASAPQIAPSQD